MAKGPIRQKNIDAADYNRIIMALKWYGRAFDKPKYVELSKEWEKAKVFTCNQCLCERPIAQESEKGTICKYCEENREK